MNDIASSWKNISVFLDDTTQGERVAEYAATLAQAFSAHLIGIHGIEGNPGEYATDCFALGRKAIGTVISRHREAEETEAVAVGRRFGGLSAKYEVSSEFRVIWKNRADREALANSLHCDLVVLAHPKPRGLPESWTAKKLLMASGVPVVIIPDGWHGDAVGGSAVVAWNGSREARRAIADALPLLRRASAVTVLVVDAAKTPERFGDAPGVDIATYLARHGVQVEVEQRQSNGAGIAGTIAGRAMSLGASLLVIGAFSRAQSAELIFGGVSRVLLSDMPVPLFASR